MHPQTTSSRKWKKRNGIPLPSDFRKCSTKPSQLSSLQDAGYVTSQFMLTTEHVHSQTMYLRSPIVHGTHRANTSLTGFKLANLQSLQSNLKVQSFKPLEQKQKERMTKGRHVASPCIPHEPRQYLQCRAQTHQFQNSHAQKSRCTSSSIHLNPTQSPTYICRKELQ